MEGYPCHADKSGKGTLVHPGQDRRVDRKERLNFEKSGTMHRDAIHAAKNVFSGLVSSVTNVAVPAKQRQTRIRHPWSLGPMEAYFRSYQDILYQRRPV